MTLANNEFRAFPQRLVKCASMYFREKPSGELPPILKPYEGAWMVSNAESYVSLFYLSDLSLQRIKDYKNRGWHPFPGLFTPNNDSPAAFALNGSMTFLDSNITSGGYAFRIGRSASCIIHNHHHTAIDADGTKADCTVDLAFVVGVQEGFEPESVIDVFRSLFDHLVEVWKKRL